MILSRFSITGPIHENTPLCVISEMAEAHGIQYEMSSLSDSRYVEKVIRTLKEKEPEIVRMPPEEGRDWALLTRYINPDPTLRWTPEPILTAWSFLEKFSCDHAIDWDSLSPHFSFGWPTPTDPTKWNACILYRLCLESSFQLHRPTTLDQMAWGIKLRMSEGGACLRMIYQFLNFRDLSDWIQVWVFGNSGLEYVDPQVFLSSEEEENALKEEIDFVSHDRLQELLSYYSDLKNVWKMLPVLSKEEAIALGALNFQWDLSLAWDPVQEYLRLQKFSSGYVPIDPALKKLYLLNPALLNLHQTFQPLFPADYYEPSALRRMALEEGFTDAELAASTPYELLQLSYVLENFYAGLYPEIINEETPIAWEEVAFLEPGTILCYGVRNQSMMAMTFSELADAFLAHKAFLHPLSKHPLPERAMRKLRRMVRPSRDSGSPSSLESKNDLYRVIQDVEIFTSEALTQVRDFYYQDQSSSPSQQQALRETWHKFLHLAMYMRGWKGPPEPYPIQEAPVDDQVDVDWKVTEALADLETSCQTLGEMGERLLDLPLVKYERSTFISASTAREGYTLRARLDFVKKGEDEEALSSCIRLSSNWLAASAHRYMTLLGMDPPFVLEELRSIS